MESNKRIAKIVKGIVTRSFAESIASELCKLLLLLADEETMHFAKNETDLPPFARLRVTSSQFSIG